MRLYFIPNLPERSIRRLEAGGVSLARQSIDDREGVLFDGQYYGQVLAVLGANSAVDSLTSQDDVHLLSLALTGAPSPVVLVQSWGNRTADAARYARTAQEVLLPFCGHDVVLHGDSNRIQQPIADGDLHICIGMAPSDGRAKCKAPEVLWGRPVEYREDAYSAEGAERLILDDEGMPVGEVAGKTFYLHHIANKKGSDKELAIFRLFCEEVLAFVCLTAEQLRDRATLRLDQRISRRRLAYMEMCRERVDSLIAKQAQSLTNMQSRLRKLEAELVSLSRGINNGRAALSDLTRRRADDIAALGKEFDQLLTDPKVLDVKVTANTVHVFTDTLYCFNPETGIVHEIGKMQIDIHLDARPEALVIRNLTRQVHGLNPRMHHPHIFEDGRPCFGSSHADFLALLSQYEVAAVAFLAIGFIESVNPCDAAGENITHWPRVPLTKVRELQAAKRIPQDLSLAYGGIVDERQG